MSVAVHAQTFPYEAQFHRLMGEPKKTVSALLVYPWKDNVQLSPPGLNNTAHGETIRIVSAERPVSNYDRWSHWSNSDGTVWVDVVDFSSKTGAGELLSSANQRNTGYLWENQLLLFTSYCDSNKDAIGAAFISPARQLVNIGIKLERAICMNGTVTEADLQSVDNGITRLQHLLESLAPQMLDSAYVTFDPKISPKPDAVRLLRVAAFTRLWTEVKYNFVYFDKRPGLNWDRVLERYLPRVAAAKDDVEYGRVLEEVIALLKDGHTNVYPTAVASEDGPLIRLEPIQGNPVVVAVGNLPELKLVKPGMELVDIDHTPVRTVIERDLDPYIASSTAQDRALREMRMLLNGQPDSTVHTKWLDLQGNTIELDLRRDGSKNRAALPTRNWKRFEYQELPGNISYMALNDFGDKGIVSDFESRLERTLPARAWILDLRENGGGSSSIAYGILGHFLNATAQGGTWRTRLYNPTFQAWGQPLSWYEGDADVIKPADKSHYSGPVYVLTGPSTCSAAEDFLIPLRTQRRATLVGEATCGSSGQPLYFAIFGADVRICTKWDRFPDGTEFVGLGIIPDVEAHRTKEDVATGRDAVLETAIRLASR
jgi:C-terminal processing protease CtpA/Prc